MTPLNAFRWGYGVMDANSEISKPNFLSCFSFLADTDMWCSTHTQLTFTWCDLSTHTYMLVTCYGSSELQCMLERKLKLATLTTFMSFEIDFSYVTGIRLML